jgi:hypothetical protein
VARNIIEERPRELKERECYGGLPTVEEAALQAALAHRAMDRPLHRGPSRVQDARPEGQK